MGVASPLLLLEVWCEVERLVLLETVEDDAGPFCRSPVEETVVVVVLESLNSPPVLLGRVEDGAGAFCRSPAEEEAVVVPESPRSPIVPNISLAKEESASTVPLGLVSLVDDDPNMLPPLRKALKAESPKRESPSREEEVVDGGGGSLAAEEGLLLCPDECPTVEGCPNDD